MNKEELLYNDIYNRTQDFGRTQFVREIMKLQDKINELETKINTYENPEDMTLMFMWCNEKSKDKIKELQQKVNHLELDVDSYKTKYKRANELYLDICKEVKQLETNIDEAYKLLDGIDEYMLTEQHLKLVEAKKLLERGKE